MLCHHALSNAHRLRELTCVFEEMGQAWANRLIEMLVAACHEVTAAGGPLSQDRSAYFRTLYLEIITEGEAANPRAALRASAVAPAEQGRQSAPPVAHHTNDVLRFMADPGVPFSNNLAEQAVRMPKVKHKVSGCFRTLAGAQSFCIVRSYLEAPRKQGANLFHALTLTFQGNVPQRRLA